MVQVIINKVLVSNINPEKRKLKIHENQNLLLTSYKQENSLLRNSFTGEATILQSHNLTFLDYFQHYYRH